MNKSAYIEGILAITPGLTTQEIADKAECTPQMVNYIRRKRRQRRVPPKPADSIIGVISDTHLPAEHPGYFEFVVNTFDRWGVTDVVHIGDLIDFHRASRHVSEPGAMTIMDELEMTIEALRKWKHAFPHVYWCKGNHDMIPYRQAKELGMPEEFIKSLHQLLELPETWELEYHHVLDGCYFEHGLGSGGMYGAKNTSLKYRMNYVQGHTHANAGIFYNSGPNDTIFGMNVGAGCDASHISQSYGENYKSKITHGCGIVVNGREGYFVPMI